MQIALQALPHATPHATPLNIALAWACKARATWNLILFFYDFSWAFLGIFFFSSLFLKQFLFRFVATFSVGEVRRGREYKRVPATNRGLATLLAKNRGGAGRSKSSSKLSATWRGKLMLKLKMKMMMKKKMTNATLLQQFQPPSAPPSDVPPAVPPAVLPAVLPAVPPAAPPAVPAAAAPTPSSPANLELLPRLAPVPIPVPVPASLPTPISTLPYPTLLLFSSFLLVCFIFLLSFFLLLYFLLGNWTTNSTHLFVIALFEFSIFPSPSLPLPLRLRLSCLQEEAQESKENSFPNNFIVFSRKFACKTNYWGKSNLRFK